MLDCPISRSKEAGEAATQIVEQENQNNAQACFTKGERRAMNDESSGWPGRVL
jgi:hypothetical protein